jgi:hypothetical protein
MAEHRLSGKRGLHVLEPVLLEDVNAPNECDRRVMRSPRLIGWTRIALRSYAASLITGPWQPDYDGLWSKRRSGS